MDTGTSILIGIIGFLAANFGTIIYLHTWSVNRMDKNAKETRDLIQGISNEMKDFHGRLCAIEERNSVRLLNK
jgi:hypothetical protein